MVAGPYNRQNPQRPDYVDEIQCNWTGHNVDAYSVYICKVNTTEAKHTDLNSRAGVRQLPRAANWNTQISTLAQNTQNVISNWCAGKDIPFDSSDTIGELLVRIIAAGIVGFGNISLATQYQTLSQNMQDKILAIVQRFNLPSPQPTTTVRTMARVLGLALWPGNDEKRVRVDEF